MYEVAPTLGHFVVEEAPRLAQLVILATLCGWVAHRLVGLNLNLRGLRIFFGLAGLEAGAWLWQSFSFQPGPTVADFSLAASLAGALGLFGFLKLLEVAIAAAEAS
jgi:uncharacterized membrane protein YeaQ/YmgE (transglycosylase-associated protein family)